MYEQNICSKCSFACICCRRFSVWCHCMNIYGIINGYMVSRCSKLALGHYTGLVKPQLHMAPGVLFFLLTGTSALLLLMKSLQLIIVNHRCSSYYYFCVHLLVIFVVLSFKNLFHNVKFYDQRTPSYYLKCKPLWRL